MNAHDIAANIENLDIVCLLETCTISQPSISPAWLRNPIIIHSPAVKDKTKGRASGGIIIALKKQKYKYELIINTKEIVCIEVCLESFRCIVAAVYLNQELDNDTCINILN